jgi:hypothetical protein
MFKSFKPFNRFATFKSLSGFQSPEDFHVSGILETSKRLNSLGSITTKPVIFSYP